MLSNAQRTVCVTKAPVTSALWGGARLITLEQTSRGLVEAVRAGRQLALLGIVSEVGRKRVLVFGREETRMRAWEPEPGRWRWVPPREVPMTDKFGGSPHRRLGAIAEGRMGFMRHGWRRSSDGSSQRKMSVGAGAGMEPRPSRIYLCVKLTETASR